MNIENQLASMMSDLKKLNRDKDQLKSKYIEERLNATTRQYLHDLTLKILSAQNRNAIKLLREVEDEEI